MNNFLFLSLQYGIRASTILTTAHHPLTISHLVKPKQTTKREREGADLALLLLPSLLPPSLSFFHPADLLLAENLTRIPSAIAGVSSHDLSTATATPLTAFKPLLRVTTPAKPSSSPTTPISQYSSFGPTTCPAPFQQRSGLAHATAVVAERACSTRKALSRFTHPQAFACLADAEAAVVRAFPNSALLHRILDRRLVLTLFFIVIIVELALTDAIKHFLSLKPSPPFSPSSKPLLPLDRELLPRHPHLSCHHP